MLVDGIEYSNEEFGGRAKSLKFFRKRRSKRCTKYGNEIASLAAGKKFGVAKYANIYRYPSIYIHT